MEIIKLLEKSVIVADFHIIDFKSWNEGYFLKLKIELTNNTLLFASEYYDDNIRNYSFH